MRKLVSILLVTLFALSASVGTAVAGPRDNVPPSTSGGAQGKGAITVKIKESGTNERVGTWSCSGVFVKNKNHSRVNLECKIQDAGTLSGTYSSATHDVPVWLQGEAGTYAAEANALADLTGLTTDDLSGWSVTVTPNGNGSAHVSGVAFFD